MGDRIDLKKQLQSLAFQQAGYFSAGQALDVGYSYQAQKYHVDRGNWQRVDRALFRLPGWPSEAADIYVRWCVWSGTYGVISHQSAADVHGLGDFDAGDVHLTLPEPSKATPVGAMLHSGSLSEDEIQRERGFRVTTPLRTVLDLAASNVAQESITAVIRDGLDASKLTARRLRIAADSFGPTAALRIERALLEVHSERGEE
ncbi:UNVERIFIED_ORG: putative transcriptional regulator of viral defense system [Arthrobacter sp. UYEF10]